jgi:hypothetical protein
MSGGETVSGFPWGAMQRRGTRLALAPTPFPAETFTRRTAYAVRVSCFRNAFFMESHFVAILKKKEMDLA